MDTKPTACDRRGFVKLAAAGAAAMGAAAVLPAGASADEPAGTPESAAASAPTIYIVDRIVTKPGMGREVYDLYLEHFEPFAAERGMVLDRAVIAPPIWLTDDVSCNTLEFVWAVEGYPAFAGAITYSNPEAVAWWDGIEERAVSRDRSYFATPADAEVLSNV